MGKTIDLFEKIRDTKGIFHAKMSPIKYKNGMNLTEEDIKNEWKEYTEALYRKDLHDLDNADVVNLTEEDIKKEWKEYTEALYRKDLHDLDNADVVIRHLEPDILE